MPFASVDEIRRANERAGYHWFDTDTRRFFKSRPGTEVYGGCFFTSSEVPPHGRREYTVNYACDDGSIHKASEPQEFATAAQAKGAAKRYAAGNLVARDGWGYLAWTLGERMGDARERARSRESPFDPDQPALAWASSPMAREFRLFYQYDPCRALNTLYEASGRGNTPNPDLLLAEMRRTAEFVERNG